MIANVTSRLSERDSSKLMAAVPKNRRPELLSKLEGHTGSINRAKIVQGEDAVITVSDDKCV